MRNRRYLLHAIQTIAVIALIWGLDSKCFGDHVNNAFKVMDVTSDAVAYDFSAVALGLSEPYTSRGYLAIFHAEPYAKQGNCFGDSIAFKYAGPDPVLPFGTHSKDKDMLITRTDGLSDYMFSANGC